MQHDSQSSPSRYKTRKRLPKCTGIPECMGPTRLTQSSPELIIMMNKGVYAREHSDKNIDALSAIKSVHVQINMYRDF